MIKEHLKRYADQKKTLLGVGAMSTNCIDAVVELSNEYNIPILLIASRRQIDSLEFGGGYVNHWTMEDLARYVFDNDMGGKVLLCRDHGGPWQNTEEQKKNLGLRDAMESAKRSYTCDVENGVQILHIDPSVDIHKRISINEVVDRLLELYEHCWSVGEKRNSKIEFEIGTEEQSGGTGSAVEFEVMLKRVNRHCDKYHMPRPLFVVIQNGTKVMETRNVGSFDIPVRIAGEVAPEIQIPLMSKICSDHGILVKAHNTDYLTDDSLRWYPRLGIHAANVAPEYGVVESRALVNMLEEQGMGKIADSFLELSFRSGMWKKWVLPDTKATDRECALMAGHYVFSTPEFFAIKSKASVSLQKKGINLDQYLKEQIKRAIKRYLIDFRMVI